MQSSGRQLPELTIRKHFGYQSRISDYLYKLIKNLLTRFLKESKPKQLLQFDLKSFLITESMIIFSQDQRTLLVINSYKTFLSQEKKLQHKSMNIFVHRGMVFTDS